MAFKDKYYKHNVDNFWSFKGSAFKGEFPTLREMFELSVNRFGKNDCFKTIVPEKKTYTYEEVLKRVKKLSYFLIKDGVRKGDKICVSGKNSPEWAITYLSITFAGGIIVPLDYALHPEDMEKILSFGDVGTIFMDDEKIDEVDKESKFIKKRYSLESGTHHQYVLDLEGEECELPSAECNEIAAILFTSGTTGMPKGVMLTHSNLMSSTLASQRIFDHFCGALWLVLPN